MGQRRMDRVTELIRQEVSKLIPHLRDPNIGFTTIMAVRLNHDFSCAEVYFSVLGTPEDKLRTQKALERAAPFIRSQMRKLESLKTIPELTFHLDNSVEEAQGVLDILSKLKTEEKDHPPLP